LEKLMDRRALTRRRSLAGLLSIAFASACSGGRTAPPVTAPSPGAAGTHARGLELPVSETFERAVAQGTRTRTGTPGPHYWQQWSEYKLEAELNPISKRLTGQGKVTYYNRSPDTLQEV